jgi:hypothetical protein
MLAFALPKPERSNRSSGFKLKKENKLRSQSKMLLNLTNKIDMPMCGIFGRAEDKLTS